MPDKVHNALPVPLILGVNGSKNWSEHHLEYMSMFRDMGFATFELQSFNSRNVRSTVGEQVSVTTAMMILDAYKALDVLAADSRIDINNIGRKITNEVLNIQLYIPAEPARIIKGTIPKVFRIKISNKFIFSRDILL